MFVKNSVKLLSKYNAGWNFACKKIFERLAIVLKRNTVIGRSQQLTTKARNSGTLLKLNLSKVKSCNFAKARTLQVYHK